MTRAHPTLKRKKILSSNRKKRERTYEWETRENFSVSGMFVMIVEEGGIQSRRGVKLGCKKEWEEGKCDGSRRVNKGEWVSGGLRNKRQTRQKLDLTGPLKAGILGGFSALAPNLIAPSAINATD